MRRVPMLWALILAATVAVGLVGFGGIGGGRGGGQGGDLGSAFSATEQRAHPDQELLVSAASSLQDVFRRLAIQFEQVHPGVNVTLNLGGSQRLRSQIEQGAPADVFVSANRRYVDALERQGLVEPGRTFAVNKLVVIAPSDNPPSIHNFEDLPQAERIVLGASDVPVGQYADRILQEAANRFGAAFLDGVEEHAASRELNVRQVVAKVVLGEADAGIVYETDARNAKGRVRAVTIPDELNVEAEYVMAIVKNTSVPELARQWMDYVRSPFGRSVLAEYGFTPLLGDDAS